MSDRKRGPRRRLGWCGVIRHRVCRLLTLTLGCLFVCNAAMAAQATYEQTKAAFRASDVLMLDRAGELLQRVRLDYQERRGDWLALEDVSPALQRAVIQSEDQRFYAHSGVDWQAIAGAAWSNLTQASLRGASTLSMQLVGLIDAHARRAATGRSLGQKIDQAIAARTLERHWTKPQILEAYLNLASFRGELVGVDALSRVLFQKHASGLNGREAAIAAVLLRGPNARPALIVKRACRLLVDMGMPEECQHLFDFVSITLTRSAAIRANNAILTPHYARFVLGQLPGTAKMPGMSVNTDLDANLQRFALQSVDRHLRTLRQANVQDAAVVVLDNRTGGILTYIGSSGEFSAAQNVDHARALRQAGSTLKPFLYAQALEEQRLTTVSLLSDDALILPTGNGLYIPQNYDKRFAGWVSVRTALASSLNIPAVRTLLMVTPGAFAKNLVRLGLPLDQSGDFYGYSLALGSADVTLLSLTNAYRALANLGVYSPIRLGPFVKEPTESKQILSSGASWIIGDILSDRLARVYTFGLDSPLSTPFWTAVKTGTSKDMRDNWCLGWSEHYTVGVWVGNSVGASMHEVSGVSGSGPIWHEIMTYLHRRRDSIQPPMPKGISRTTVVFEHGIEPAREDVFLGDTAVARVQLGKNTSGQDQRMPRIYAPADGTLFALDPDIPVDHQRIFLRATNVFVARDSDVIWRLDKREIGRGQEVAWAPSSGRHHIELVDQKGNVLDQVRIEVRGLGFVQGLMPADVLP